MASKSQNIVKKAIKNGLFWQFSVYFDDICSIADFSGIVNPKKYFLTSICLKTI